MNENKYYLAIDIGASSGRHIVGYCDGNNIITNEVYRFKNGMKKINNTTIWDYQHLFKEIKKGIKEAFNKYKRLESLAIDTWGVDYALLQNDKVIEPIYAYRDIRTLKVIEKVHNIISFDYLYKKTGIQYAPFNTIYQLYDDLEMGRLKKSTDFLMLPQFFSYLLTGKKIHEYTDCSTTSLVNISSLEFDDEIISKLCFPKTLFSKISKPGTFVGYLKEDISNEVLGNTKVLLCASHDTASAFEAINCDNDSIIISSGTWSLIGTKISKASTSKSSQLCNFSNEGGVGYFRYLKNIMGMWLVNESRKKYDISFDQLINGARLSNYNFIFDVNDESLLNPSNMIVAIKSLLLKNNYPLPASPYDLFSSIFNSLAYSYKIATKEIEKNLGKVFSKIYIVGGGANNTYINELTEKFTNKKIIPMPIEATAIGNLKNQMKMETIKNGEL